MDGGPHDLDRGPLESIDTTITSVAQVPIPPHFGATLAALGWVITGYAGDVPVGGDGP